MLRRPYPFLLRGGQPVGSVPRRRLRR